MKSKTRVRLPLLGGLALLGISCRDAPEPAGKRYELSGQVVAVDRESRRLTISHENIPNFMDAMTMPFTVKDDWVFEAVAPGDEVEATLVVTDDSSWLEDLVISRKGDGDAPTQAAPPFPGEPNAGDAVPDFALINQSGDPIHLGQYRGKALVLTFIYTRCPLPEYCPRMTSQFAKLDRALRDEPELYEKTHLLSISFDPDYDSPSVLRDYAAREVPGHEGSFEHWELATGSHDEVKAITEFFGLTYVPEKDQFVHSLRTALIRPDGVLHRLYRGNDW
jgi:protein SCO1/2